MAQCDAIGYGYSTQTKDSALTHRPGASGTSVTAVALGFKNGCQHLTFLSLSTFWITKMSAILSYQPMASRRGMFTRTLGAQLCNRDSDLAKVLDPESASSRQFKSFSSSNLRSPNPQPPFERLPTDMPAPEPCGSASCYWNGYGSSATTRLKDLPSWPPGLAS